jgi:hypothetical protein
MTTIADKAGVTDEVCLPPPPIDWNTKVDKEKGVFLFKDGDKNVEFILLAELQRLAELRGGIKHQITHVVQAPNPSNEYSACCTVDVVFHDGKSTSGSGDCSKENTSGDYAVYPTAMAESRALARALRFGLGIKMCSWEEVSGKSLKNAVESSNKEVTQPQKIAITTICARNNFDLAKILAMGSRKGIETVEQLTSKEASDLIAKLNDGTIKKLLKDSK